MIELLSEYIDGTCNEDVGKELSQHLETCADCKTAYVCEKAIIEACGDFGDEEPPEDFQATLMEKIRMEAAENSRKEIQFPRKKEYFSLFRVSRVAAILVVSLSIGLLISLALQQQRPSVSLLTSPENVVDNNPATTESTPRSVNGVDPEMVTEEASETTMSDNGNGYIDFSDPTIPLGPGVTVVTFPSDVLVSAVGDELVVAAASFQDSKSRLEEYEKAFQALARTYNSELINVQSDDTAIVWEVTVDAASFLSLMQDIRNEIEKNHVTLHQQNSDKDHTEVHQTGKIKLELSFSQSGS